MPWDFYSFSQSSPLLCIHGTFCWLLEFRGWRIDVLDSRRFYKVDYINRDSAKFFIRLKHFDFSFPIVKGLFHWILPPRFQRGAQRDGNIEQIGIQGTSFHLMMVFLLLVDIASPLQISRALELSFSICSVTR